MRTKNMVSVEEALQIILGHAYPLKKEKVPLRRSLGRTLARDIVAGEDIPARDNSSMDGYALLSSDLTGVSEEKPMFLDVTGESPAGHPFRSRVRSGQTVRIMTGGAMPPGADAIAPIERVTIVDSRRIMLSQPLVAGEHVRRAGDDVRRGEIALSTGQVLGPAHLGILASLGLKKISVYQVPRVNILATGDELIPIGEEPAEGQIRNSTSLVLEAYVRQAGGEPVFLGIVRDTKKAIARGVRKALDAHLLLITGGVSVGAYDLVGPVLREIGVDVKFWKVNIKPGKPLLFGVWGETLVFGLPGNPVSTSICFLKFVRPALYAMSGRDPESQFRIRAVLDQQIRKSDARRHYVRGVMQQMDGEVHVRTTGSQSSGVMSSMAKANCLIVIPEEVEKIAAGERVDIEFL
jgi:molybdopterin molybdotransferase